MFIHVTPKRMDKGYVVSATFEHQGVAYEERFVSKKRFLDRIKRGKDTFVSAVDYTDMVVIKRETLEEYKASKA